MNEEEAFNVAWEEYAVTHDMDHPAEAKEAFVIAWSAGWGSAIYAAQESLVSRDQFSERTLRILDELMQQ